ncbi:LEA type 2 family protein [Pseudomonas sp. nanlin1]|uniref:LEA type 2 family protein n=1 Tax=Pseudomonas sp. nanlin1 TaxID=3040605 RepID=UPI0038910C00
MRTLLRPCLAVLLSLALGACASFSPHDPVNITVVGIQPLPAQELEVRFAVKLRLQNPNETAIDYTGIALSLDVNGHALASGVSDQEGRIERFSEAVLVVPVSISAFSALRQAVGLNPGQSLNDLPYELNGKLAGGLFGTSRFSATGRLNLPSY